MRFALIALLALAAPAAAEINMADSIEWQTIDSDVIVRGFVTDVAPKKLGKRSWFEVTVQISESIKGGVKKQVRFGVDNPTQPDTWLDKKTDLVVFLVAGKDRASDDPDFAQFTYALRATGGENFSAFELGTHTAYTITYDAITKSTDVLAAIRAAAKSSATTSFRVDVPWDTPAMKSLYGGSAVWMTVPVDAALEKQAIRWLGEKHSRVQAVSALGHFKSDVNIARMKVLASDPDANVRKAARDVLKSWHISQP